MTTGAVESTLRKIRSGDAMGTLHRYEVVGVDGDVPEGIRDLVGASDAFLLFDEYRGEWFTQNLWRDGVGLVGGWTCEYRGVRP